ncbi:hypothetical protein [Cryptosporangium minutisporangium]
MYTGRWEATEPAAPAEPTAPSQPGAQDQGRGLRWWQNALITALASILILGGAAYRWID